MSADALRDEYDGQGKAKGRRWETSVGFLDT